MQVPDTFHAERSTPNTRSGSASNSVEAEYMKELLDQHELLKENENSVEELEAEEGLATARLRNIKMSG